LKKQLEENKITVDDIVVYDTAPNSNLEGLLRHHSIPNWMIFFSPSGARFSLPIMHRIAEEKFKAVRLMAIGQTTKKEIEDFGYHVDSVSEKPNPQSLIKALF